MFDSNADILNKKDKFTAVLVGVINQKQTEVQALEYLDELAFLARTAGVDSLKYYTQSLEKPNPKTFVGTGKLDEIAAYVKANKIDFIIFDDELSPSQLKSIEELTGCKILDRSDLILFIFQERAQTAQAKAQVELAQMQYLLPRLKRMWTHLERQRGGYGFLGGPGESQIELDKRMINKRIKQLKFMIEKIKKTRNMQYINREKTKVPVVALLGYTNAGKSTLFNALTKLNVKAKNKLFETLDTKISYFYLENTKKVYISDTVGFISDLPTLLVEAFKSTLDEVKKADLLVHVRDSCSKNTESEKEDVLKVLSQLNINPNSSDGPLMIEVMNKIDKAPANIKENLYNIKNLTFISALTGEGIKLLKNKIDKTLIKKLKSN